MSRLRSLLSFPILVFAANPVFSQERHTDKLLPRIYFPRLLRTNWVACVGMASLLALSGGASVQVKLGWKVYLDKTPVVSMQASLPKGPGVAPGEKSPLVVA